MKLPTSSQPTTIRISANELGQAQQQRQLDRNNLVKDLIKQYYLWQKLARSLGTETSTSSSQQAIAEKKPIPPIKQQLDSLRQQAELATARSDLEYFRN